MMDENVKTKKIQTSECIQNYYTIDLSKEQNKSSIQDGYYDFLKSIPNNEYVIFEKVFGNLKYQHVIDEVHARYLLHTKKTMHPITFIEGMPIDDSMFSGAVIHTVRYNENVMPKIRYIADDDIPYAAEYYINNVRKLYLTNSFQTRSLHDKLTSDMQVSFDKLRECMDLTKMHYHSLVRTWFYLNEIDTNYSDFNLVRRDFFDSLKIDYSEKSSQLPASTCIEGNNSGTNCSMQFYCCEKNSNVQFERVFNKDQNEAEGKDYLYQPTFSRAIKISYKDHIELQISGTASINDRGQTIYENDPYNQMKRTLLHIKNLLDAVGMSFCDIVFSTCFYKDEKYFDLFETILSDLKINNFPAIHVMGNVCRNDLLFEMDAVAVRKID